MRFDGQKYLAEAKAETSLPEWSGLGAVAVMAVLAVILGWGLVTSFFDDSSPAENPPTVTEPANQDPADDAPTAAPAVSVTQSPDQGRPATPMDTAAMAADVYFFGKPGGLTYQDGTPVAVRPHGILSDGSVVAFSEETPDVFTMTVDIDGSGPGTERVTARFRVDSTVEPAALVEITE